MSDNKAKSAAKAQAKAKPAAKATVKRAAKPVSRAKMKAQTKAVKTRAAKVTPTKKVTPAKAKPVAPKKRGVPKGTKRAALNKDGTPRKRPGPKPKATKPKTAAKPTAAKTLSKPKPVTKANTTLPKKRGVPKGTKRSTLNKDGTPRKRPGPKPKTTAVAKTKIVKKAGPKKKTVTKKSTAKTTAAKKVVVKKTVAKKGAKKKPTALKPALKKAAAKPKAQVATKHKPVAKRKNATKAVAPVATKPPKNVKELHSHVERVAAKLSRADARVARNVKTLNAAIKDLEKRSEKTNATQRAGLVRRIKNVKSQLSSLAIETRQNTRKDLEAALITERPEQMQAILTKVETRIDAASTEQSRSLARLNQHLADMARAMDARLVAIESAQAQETESRRAAVDVLTGRIDAIESETARAVTDIGERMIALATGLREEIETVKPADGQDVSEKIASIASETQGQLEAFRVQVDRRVDTAERSASDADSRVAEMARRQEGALAALTTRIEGLEYALSNVPTPQAPSALAPTAPEPSSVVELRKDLMQPAVATAAPASFEEMASTPVQRDPNLPEHYPIEYVPPASTNPVAVPQPVMPVPAGLASEVDKGQVPQPQFPQPQFAQPEDLVLPGASASAIPQPDFLPLGDMESYASAIPQPLPEIDPSIIPQIGEADLPFTNPGYAETGASARPAGFEEVKPSLLSRLKGRNVRAAGLAVGVALVGTWVVSNALGDGGRLEQAQNMQAEPSAQAPQQLASLEVPPTQSSPANVNIQTTSPIGNTQELNVATVAPDSAEGATLEAAVKAGNPVAQYQFGLMEVNRGNLSQGMSSIRKAADQGLPAAQYRLAKFYEMGEGVERDLPMAAQLTERAARSGHRIAMHDIGLFNAEGLATGEPNPIAALEWFDKAARLGVVDSQFNLAYLLDQGEVIGVQTDPVQAYSWYSIASVNGDQQAGEYMTRLRERMTSEQISAAEARVAAFRVQPINKAANGIFENLPWTPPEAAVKSAERENVRRVQELLNQLGFETGKPDGVMGPRTREAIVQYERTRQMPETGQPSLVLLKTLEGDV